MAEDSIIELGGHESPDEIRLRAELPLLLKSRWAAWIFVAASFVVAATSLLLFVYQFQSTDLYGEPYRETRGSWVQLFGHLVRGAVSGWLCMATLLYLRELGSLQVRAEDELGPLFTAISRSVKAIGVSCLMLLSLGALIVFDKFYGLPSFPSKSRMSQVVVDDPASIDAPAIRVALHEAQYVEAEGWITNSIAKTKIVHEPVYLNPDPIVVTEDIVEAAPKFDEHGGPALMLRFSAAGAVKLGDATERLINKPVAIVIDDEILSIPTVRVSLRDSVLITGETTEERLRKIADSINGSRAKGQNSAR